MTQMWYSYPILLITFSNNLPGQNKSPLLSALMGLSCRSLNICRVPTPRDPCNVKKGSAGNQTRKLEEWVDEL
jgi:hypothetical protein